ncbi:hypothetical protein BSQ44_25950 (plasmid) [Aquibium oceanicum]|uniref:Pentapeptide MXKDX repeat protein n=1 Tax=Aquibium oceanicum TaxID=1670800 RepID=A0A1L3SZZ0_9HYPH|nr:hypothetical protein BSQ44_25950 [Aquibium oceanicum]
MRRSTKTFAAAPAFAAGLATIPLHAQDPKESSSSATMEGGMMGQDGMAGMMTQMNEMMTTCNQMMQAKMDDADVPGTSRDTTPEDDV